MKTIYLHIGHYKTGSSAIQAYLSRHADDLRATGYLYPDVCRPRNNPTNHGHLSLSLGRDHGFHPPPWYGENVSADTAFATLDAALRAAPEPNVILSSEEFVQLAMRADPKAAVNDLAQRLSGHDVRVIFYLREPMSLLKSWFNEVNKGPAGTRTFPTFYAGLNGGFLSQRPIVETFQKIFGKEKTILLPYRYSGTEHITQFLGAIGCVYQPTEDASPLVNEGQPLKILETSRIGKGGDKGYDRVTLTGIQDIANFAKRTEAIRRNYQHIADQVKGAKDAELTSKAVFDHYATLLAAIHDDVGLNPQEADIMRNLALQADPADLELARTMMGIAHLIRPDASFISSKLQEYDQRLLKKVPST